MISRSRLIIANIAGVLVICFFIAAGAYFYYEKSNFIKTEDAVVAADMMPVVAPAPGVLASWNIQEGVDVSDKSIVGGVSDGTKTIPVSSRMKGKIIKNDARGGTARCKLTRCLRRKRTWIICISSPTLKKTG